MKESLSFDASVLCSSCQYSTDYLLGPFRSFMHETNNGIAHQLRQRDCYIRHLPGPVCDIDEACDPSLDLLLRIREPAFAHIQAALETRHAIAWLVERIHV